MCDTNSPFSADSYPYVAVRFQVRKWFLSIPGNGKELEARVIVAVVATEQLRALYKDMLPPRDYRTKRNKKKYLYGIAFLTVGGAAVGREGKGSRGGS